MGKLTARGRQAPARIRLFQVILLIVVSIIAYGALVLPELLLPAAVPLKPGNVSPNDFQAPQSLEYISEVRTEEARQAAERLPSLVPEIEESQDDLFLPDLIPFVDEILLGLSTLLLAAWRRRRKNPADVSDQAPRIP